MFVAGKLLADCSDLQLLLPHSACQINLLPGRHCTHNEIAAFSTKATVHCVVHVLASLSPSASSSLPASIHCIGIAGHISHFYCSHSCPTPHCRHLCPYTLYFASYALCTFWCTSAFDSKFEWLPLLCLAHVDIARRPKIPRHWCW
jgi:hypothetical protein